MHFLTATGNSTCFLGLHEFTWRGLSLVTDSVNISGREAVEHLTCMDVISVVLHRSQWRLRLTVDDGLIYSRASSGYPLLGPLVRCPHDLFIMY